MSPPPFAPDLRFSHEGRPAGLDTAKIRSDERIPAGDIPGALGVEMREILDAQGSFTSRESTGDRSDDQLNRDAELLAACMDQARHEFHIRQIQCL